MHHIVVCACDAEGVRHVGVLATGDFERIRLRRFGIVGRKCAVSDIESEAFSLKVCGINLDSVLRAGLGTCPDLKGKRS